uniref:Uncharacterized protein n=1 Tax=Globisporangium ultimum (strain ATCC 200006 / CBS 805.95 / DAOM BR144) TaxID=431595 RepID=K3WCT2_GLOUD
MRPSKARLREPRKRRRRTGMLLNGLEALGHALMHIEIRQPPRLEPVGAKLLVQKVQHEKQRVVDCMAPSCSLT